MKKHWFLGALLLACGAFAAATPWDIPDATLRGQILPQVAAIAGLPSGQATQARFTLLPVPRLDMEEIALRDANGSVTVDVERLRARVRLLPLIGGRLELIEASLFNPRLAYVADGTAAPTLRRMAVVLTPGGDAFNLPDVRKLAIIGGRIEAVGRTDRQTRLDSVNLIVEPGANRNTFDLEGELVWRSERIVFQSFGVDVGALMDGKAATVSARFAGDIGAVDFAGQILSGPAIEADGRLTLRTGNLRRFGHWIQLALPLQADTAVDLQGNLSMRNGNAALSNAALGLPWGRLEGVLHLKDVMGRPALSGTLAGERLDLGDGRRMSGLRGIDGQWSRDILDPAAVPAGDVDLRLSAARVTFGQSQLTNVACSLLARNGKADFTLGSSEFHKGSVKGRLSVAQAPRGLEVKLTGTFDRVDTAAALAAIADGRRLSGIGHGSFQVEGSGASTHAILRSLEGRASVTIRQGDILGINLPEVLRRIEKRPLGAALDVRGGRTPFDAAHVSARISRGVLELQEATVGSPAARVGLTGHIAIADRFLAVTGLAQLSDVPAGREPVTLPFEVTGTFDDPMIVPDARSLMRRSGSTGPFFDLRARQSDPTVVPAGGAAIAPAE